MFRYFTPDFIFDRIQDIDFDSLKKKNIKGLIFDIDNTLVSYRQERPTKEVSVLMDKLKTEGFEICFISNNSRQRVDVFNSDFNFFSYPEAKKPSVKFIKRALSAMDLKAKNAAFVGDQLFTDVMAAKRAKIMAILVTPIEPLETVFFRFKRFMEKPFIKRYYRKQRKKSKKFKHSSHKNDIIYNENGD
ncbi:MAG: YqeG family HAD IIIA-type phosphatase [Oscillospiraceae bacterium]|nr:YqeG family HAD IIIA-type phosphatase [Oscillospiraceae bacterium]